MTRLCSSWGAGGRDHDRRVVGHDSYHLSRACVYSRCTTADAMEDTHQLLKSADPAAAAQHVMQWCELMWTGHTRLAHSGSHHLITRRSPRTLKSFIDLPLESPERRLGSNIALAALISLLGTLLAAEVLHDREGGEARDGRPGSVPAACQAMPRVRKAVPSDPCANVSPHSCAALHASRATFGATQPRVRAVRMAALPPRPARAANTLWHTPGCSLTAASEPLSAIAYAVRVGSLVLIAAPLVGRVPQPALVSSV